MEKERIKRAVGYIRVSTDAQAGEDKFGVEAQKEAITEYAASHGYSVVDWFTDTVSGKSDKRPELDKILFGEYVTNPPFEAVIAFKSDRVARETKLYFYYLYILEKRNIQLISTVEAFPEGDFANIYRALMLFVAEQERKNICMRTGNGRAMKASAGGYSGGKAPFGYRPEGGRLVIDEKEAEVVRKIFELTADGMKMLRVAEWLNDNGYRSRSDGKFYTSSIKNILENEPMYRGMYRYGRGKDNKDVPWVKGAHDPILTD